MGDGKMAYGRSEREKLRLTRKITSGGCTKVSIVTIISLSKLEGNGTEETNGAVQPGQTGRTESKLFVGLKSRSEFGDLVFLWSLAAWDLELLVPPPRIERGSTV